MRSEGGCCWRLRLMLEGVGFFAGSESRWLECSNYLGVILRWTPVRGGEMKSRYVEPRVVPQLNQIAQILSAPGCGSPRLPFWVVEAPENHIPFLPSFLFFFLTFICFCVYPYLLYLVCGSQRTACGGSLLSSFGSQELNLGPHVLWQLSLPAGPSCWIPT